MIALLEAKRAGLLSRGHIVNNLIAGLVVGVVALPLAMAFAIASGAKPEQGIYTAIIAGFLTSAFGGSRLQISGPTGAFVVVLAGVTAKYGIAGLQIATLMAGLMLIGMSLAKFGGVIRFIPNPVIVGFTSGIAVIIWVGQWKDFFGLTVSGSSEHFYQKLWDLLHALPALHPATSLLGLAALVITLFSAKLLKRVPGPLVAMVSITLLQAYCQFDGVATLGSAFGGIPQTLPGFSWPDVTLGEAFKLLGPAFTIALLGAIESLLSAVVADGMAGTKHDSNQELMGAGIANIFAPLFGGFAATGAIARTATNIRNGADSPLAGIFHALILLLIVLVAAPLAAYIPICALSAILFVVAWNMSEIKHFTHLARKAPQADVALLWITFLLTVFADLVIAVNVGVLLASLLFMKRMAEAVEVREDIAAPGAENIAKIPGTLIYWIEGPFFFGAAEKLQSTLSSIHQTVHTVVLRMPQVPFIDATGLEALRALINDFQRSKTKVILCEVRPNVLRKLEKADIINAVGANNFYPSLADWQATQETSKAVASTSRSAL